MSDFGREYEPWLKERLTEKRYIHSLRVRERAVFLAEIHGADAERAGLAGLLHDCCHCVSPESQLKIIKSHGILLDDFTMAQPVLWHAIAGSLAVSDELGVTDREALLAIRYHTTGRRDMTKLEQVVYLADLTSADRSYPGLEENRAVSEKNLGKCMLKSLARTVGMLTEKSLPIVREAWEAYNYFLKETQGGSI